MRAPASVGQRVEEVDTPALLLDLDAFENNLKTLQQAAGGPNVSDAIAEAEKALGAPEALESKTLARIKFVGDDGYGAGCVGTPSNPGGYGGYPKTSSGVPI